MRFKLKYTSTWVWNPPKEQQFVEFNTLEELLNFLKEEDEPIIISELGYEESEMLNDCKYEIEVYDSPRE